MSAIILAIVAAMTAAPGRGVDLPQAVRHALSRAYGNWQFATLNPELRADVPKSTDGNTVIGDFDGDRRRDYAVQIVTGAGTERVQRVVVLLRRGAEYVPFSIEEGPPVDNVYLVLARKGELRADLDADENGDKKIRLPADAVDVVYGEAAASTCVFERVRFHCITTGD